MTGIQYQLVSANPPLFVIRKHQRNSSSDGFLFLNIKFIIKNIKKNLKFNFKIFFFYNFLQIKYI